MTDGFHGTGLPEGLPSLPTASYTLSDVCSSDLTPGITAPPPRAEAPSGPGEGLPADPSQLVTGFNFVRMVGRGGHGEVWEGRQARLGRAVAIKRLRPQVTAGGGTHDPGEALRAFRHEALTAASLDHPNIVPVYDFGIADSGEHILAMKLVRGTAWDELLEMDLEHMAPERYLSVHLPILASVCQAVAFAHSKGLIHRDLKPSQVMIGEFGETLLMDWGLAVRVADTGAPADSGVMEIPHVSVASNPAGTPAYMAPEQTTRDPSGLGVWTDIYLLGGILYQILTGRPPHLTHSAAASFERAASGAVTPPAWAASGRHVPAELDALAMEALQPSPAHRPESVRAFLARLNDYLSGATRRLESERISASVSVALLDRTLADYSGFTEALTHLGEAEALWPENPAVPRLRRQTQVEFAEAALEHGDLTLARTVVGGIDDRGVREGLQTRVEDAARVLDRQRRRLRLATTASILLPASIVVAIGMFSWRLEGARRREVAQRVRAQVAEREVAAELNYSSGLLAGSLVDQGRIAQARAVLWRIPEQARDWEWGFNAARAHQSLREYDFETIAISGDDQFAISAERSPHGGVVLALRDLESGRTLHHLARSTGRLVACRFLDPPDRVASVWESGTVLVEGVADGRVDRLDLPAANLSAVALSGDGRMVAYARGEVAVRVVEFRTGGTIGEFEFPHPGRGRPTSLLEFSPDGRFLGASNGDAAAVWDTREQRIVWELAELPWDVVTAIGFDSESIRFWFTVRTYSPGVVDLREAPGGLVYLQNPGPSGVAIAPRRGLAVVAGGPGRTASHSLASGERRGSMLLTEASDAVWVSRNEEICATTTGTAVDIWDTEDGRHQTRLVGHSEPVTLVHFMRGDRRVVTSSTDGTTRWWDARSPTDLPVFRGEAPSLQREGRHHVAIGDSNVVVRSVETGLIAGLCGGNMNRYYSVFVTPDDAEVVILGTEHDDHVVDTYSLVSRGTVGRVRLGRDVFRNFLAPGGDGVLSVSSDQRRLSLHARRTGALLRSFAPLADRCASHDFTPDGALLAVGDASGEVRVEDARSSATLWSRRVGDGAPCVVRFAGGTGRLLVLDTSLGSLIALDARTGSPLVRFETGGSRTRSFFTDAAGTRVAGVGDEGDSRIWDAASGRPVCTFRASSETTGQGTFLPGGTRMLLPSAGGFQVFDTRNGREVAAVPDKTFLQCTPDGLLLLFGEGRRSHVLRVVPWTRHGFGDAGGTFEDGFRAWRLERYRQWWIREQGSWVEGALPAARMAGSLDPHERGEAVAELLADIIDQLAPMGESTGGLLERAIVLRQAILLARASHPEVPGDGPGEEFERLAGTLALVRDPALRPLAEFALLRMAAQQATARIGRIADGGAAAQGATLLPVAKAMASLGERDAAVALLRLELAHEWTRGRSATPAEEALFGLGGSLPPRPPPGILPASPDSAEKDGPDAAARRGRLRGEYLRSVAEPPDLVALVGARWRPEFRKGPSDLRRDLDLLLGDLAREAGRAFAESTDGSAAGVRFDAMLAGSRGL